MSHSRLQFLQRMYQRFLDPRSLTERRRSSARNRLGFENVEDRVLLTVDLSLNISDGDATASPGESIAYTFEYANEGNTDSAGAVIHTYVPRHASFDADSSDENWTCTEGRRGTSCTIEIGDVAAEESSSVAFGVKVDADATRLRSIAIAGYIRDSGEAGREASRRNNFDMERTPVTRQLHDLTIDFHDSRATVVPGGTIVYTAEYANVGIAAANGASISIQLPENTSFNAASSDDGWVCNEGTCTLELANVEPGAEGSAIFAVDVDADLSSDVRSIKALARIGDDGSGVGDANPRNNSDRASTPVVHALPDLALSIDDGDAGVEPGGTIVYTLNYTNNGPVNSTGVKLRFRVPTHTTMNDTESPEGWICENRWCTFEIGDVEAGATGSVTIAVTVDMDARRRLFAFARISDDGENGRDQNLRNNFAFARTKIGSNDDGDVEPGVAAAR